MTSLAYNRTNNCTVTSHRGPSPSPQEVHIEQASPSPSHSPQVLNTGQVRSSRHGILTLLSFQNPTSGTTEPYFSLPSRQILHARSSSQRSNEYLLNFFPFRTTESLRPEQGEAQDKQQSHREESEEERGQQDLSPAGRPRPIHQEVRQHGQRSLGRADRPGPQAQDPGPKPGRRSRREI